MQVLFDIDIELRKSKYKEDTIPKSISNNIKFDISNTFTSS